jgi:hypothetical protein
MWVPATCITRTDTTLVAVRLALVVHSTVVADAHEVVEQWSAPTNAVGEPESMPKLKPVTDSTVPPERAQLVPANVTTGACKSIAELRNQCALEGNQSLTVIGQR